VLPCCILHLSAVPYYLSDKLNGGTLAAVSLAPCWKEQSPLLNHYSVSVTLSTIMSPPCLR